MNTYQPSLRWIEEQFQTSLSLVKSWSNINSYTENTEGLTKLLDRLQKDFSILEGEQTVIPLASRNHVGTLGKKVEIPVGKALRIKKRPEAALQVLLAGHMDTVYPPTSHFQKVTEVNTTTWKGPGVTDMKGGLAVMLMALAAFERTPEAYKIGWEIIINPDEEIGSVSSEYLFEEAAKRHYAGLIFEPAFADGAFVSARKGSANFTIVIHGVAAHSGRDFIKGKSAIYALAQFITALELANHPESGFSVNVGWIEAGGPVNIVPDLALCKVNIRSTDTEKIERFMSTLEELAVLCRLREGIEIEIIQDTMRLPKPFDLKNQQLFQQFETCAEELRIPFQLKESGGVCDGNILSHAGLPTIDSLGVVGGQIHTHDEFLILESLTQRAQLTALYLMKLGSENK
jgi:glutamate carboxypeptidase